MTSPRHRIIFPEGFWGFSDYGLAVEDKYDQLATSRPLSVDDYIIALVLLLP